MKKVDYIIAGLGLAGATLALQLLSHGKKVKVYDVFKSNSASQVAAGLFNPLTGKLMIKSWMADQLFSYIYEFYPRQESRIGEKFFHPFPIYIPFLSIEEQNDWAIRSAAPEWNTFINEVYTTSRYGDQVHDSFGGLLLNQTGYVDTVSYLKAIRNLLLNQGCFTDEKIIPEEVIIQPERICYRDTEVEGIIFCEGVGALSNSLFSWLPIIPLKGEVLDIQLDVRPHAIYNRGVYVVPAGGGLMMAGATYERIAEEGITEQAEAVLSEKLRHLLNIPWVVKGQRGGLRPSVKDRRPILGCHPDHSNVFIFNGMGTKGVTLAPYFSNMLADFLLHGKPIDSAVNISRFYTLYSRFGD